MLQLSLIKETHEKLQECLRKASVKVSLAQHQSLKDDLDKHKALKLDMARFFGRDDGFFDSLATFEAGHAKIYDYVKLLHTKVPQEKEPAFRNRKYSDPKYDNEEYMAQIEQSLLKTLGIPFENETEKKVEKRVEQR